MSSIEEKLSAIREIQQSLSDLLIKLGGDQILIESELSKLKERWTDPQMAAFKSETYVGKFNGTLHNLMSRISSAVDFLEHKYSTLQSHRN